MHLIEIDSTGASVQPQTEILATYGVYPNPAAGYVHIQTPDGYNGKSDMMILDMNGRILYNSMLTSSQDIDLGHFSSGLYFMRIVDQNGNSFSKKIEVQ